MKRYILVIAAFALSFVLCACGRTTPAPESMPSKPAATVPATKPMMDPTVETNIPDPSVDTSMPHMTDQTTEATGRK